MYAVYLRVPPDLSILYPPKAAAMTFVYGRQNGTGCMIHLVYLSRALYLIPTNVCI